MTRHRVITDGSDLLNRAGVAALLGVKSQTVDKIRERSRLAGQIPFPERFTDTHWRRADIIEWARQTGRLFDDVDAVPQHA